MARQSAGLPVHAKAPIAPERLRQPGPNLERVRSRRGTLGADG